MKKPQITLLVALLLSLNTLAVQAGKLKEVADLKVELIKLQAEMLRLISTDDEEAFTRVCEQLKTESRQQGEERIFYSAWGNQSTYEATHQNYVKAEQIADRIAEYAAAENSHWGNYVVLHTKAVNALQKQDYSLADSLFTKAVAFRHKYFPGESAGDDLQELMKIANHRKDQKAGLRYAHQILAEPDVAPIHKGRALYRISQFAFNKNNKVLFDSIYNELCALKKSDGIGTLEPLIEVNHLIMNENYQEALRLCQSLSPETRAERMAIIYHRMGDNDKAYEYMARFKKINDSIVLVSHGNVVASCFVQMNNERMKLEQKFLEDENVQLKRQRTYIIIIAVVIILVLLIGQHRLRIRRLEKENVRLNKAHQEALQAFDMKNEFITHITNELRKPLHPIEGFSDILGTTDYDLKPEERELLSTHIKDNSKRITRLIDELAELSYFESKSSLPVNYTISPNHLLRHMVDYMRPRCKEGVRMFLESDLSDDYTTATSQEAVETLMRHLLDNAIQFTDHGVITVACTEYGDMVRVSVTDTGCGIAPELRDHVFDTFQEMADNMKLKGLGLPICKAIVQLLGGRIWLDTDYHEGTRFIFDLPHMQ